MLSMMSSHIGHLNEYLKVKWNVQLIDGKSECAKIFVEEFHDHTVCV